MPSKRFPITRLLLFATLIPTLSVFSENTPPTPNAPTAKLDAPASTETPPAPRKGATAKANDDAVATYVDHALRLADEKAPLALFALRNAELFGKKLDAIQPAREKMLKTGAPKAMELQKEVEPLADKVMRVIDEKLATLAIDAKPTAKSDQIEARMLLDPKVVGNGAFVETGAFGNPWRVLIFGARPSLPYIKETYGPPDKTRSSKNGLEYYFYGRLMLMGKAGGDNLIVTRFVAP